MQLYLRYQVEQHAFSAKKWGSAEALDAEFERRQVDKKTRKEKKFKSKLEDLKKRTRLEAHRRARTGAAAGEDAQFGVRIVGRHDKHIHEWGRPTTDPDTGAEIKKCVECGMECEEFTI
jgi:DNA-repair protein complementing XP-A cells